MILDPFSALVTGRRSSGPLPLSLSLSPEGIEAVEADVFMAWGSPLFLLFRSLLFKSAFCRIFLDAPESRLACEPTSSTIRGVISEEFSPS